MLLRLGYLAVSNVFAVLRLLPMGDRDKDVEILALRHQIAVLERQLGGRRVHFTAADWALLAALLHRLPRQALQRLRLLVRPDTVLRRHRDLIASRHALLRALHEFEAFYNSHRPHQGIANSRPLCPLPPPLIDPEHIACLDIRRHQRLGGILNEYQHAV